LPLHILFYNNRPIALKEVFTDAMVFENEVIDQPQFESFKEDKSIKAIYMPRYNP